MRINFIADQIYDFTTKLTSEIVTSLTASPLQYEIHLKGKNEVRFKREDLSLALHVMQGVGFVS